MKLRHAGSRWTWRYVLLNVFVLTVLAVPAVSDCGYAFDAPTPAGPIKEIRFGLAAHDVDGLWSGASKEDGADLIAEVIFRRSLFRLFSATAYPQLGASINTRGYTSQVYGGLVLRWELPAAFFFSTGCGLALHNGERDTTASDQKSLGSRVLFRIPIEIGYAVNRHHCVGLEFAHVSNAYLASPNEGLDTIGLVYGYRF